MCSDCGRINDKMALDVRKWDCSCGSHHDRDTNAAKNVLAAGRADNSTDRRAQVRPGLVPAPRGPRAAWRESPSFRAERMSKQVAAGTG
nr:zinc ribbon domain-containing protein [Actinoplanes capillaceus]